MRASYYIRGITGLAAIAAATAAANWQSRDPGLFAVCAILAVMATCWKVRIPGVATNVSAGFVILLMAIGQFSFGETLVIAMASGLTQSLFRKKTPPQAIQVCFNTSALMVVASAVYLCANTLVPGEGPLAVLFRLAFSGTLLFVLNSLVMAVLFQLMGEMPLRDCWRQIRIWVAPYYAAGGVIAAAAVETNLLSSAWMGLALLPLMTLAYQYFRSFVLSGARTVSQ